MNVLLKNSSRRKPGGDRGASVLDNGYPTKELLLARNPPNLTVNKLCGSYQCVSEYLGVHFDLLLEDFVCPLRGALQKFKRNKGSSTLNGARVYHNVTLKSFRDRFWEITCMMEIDRTEGKVEPSFGCLLVFTRHGDFNKDFFLGTVISNSSKTGVDAVELRLKFPKYCQPNLRDLGKDHFIVIEGEAFFYVYFHVLKSLNTFDETNFPMKRYIVYGDKETSIRPPAYLNSSTTYKISGHDVSVLNCDKWPSPKELGMDNDSQYMALKKALTEEIALIQGPPGTGKTYFGVSLVKVWLDNESVWNPKGSTPLLIVCQSNQALDHFLEKVLVYTNKIVRIGDQCQSQKLKPLSLKGLVCRKVAEEYGMHGLDTHVKSLDKARKQIEQLTQGIVSFKSMEKYGIISKETSALFKCEDSYLCWLGMNVKAERKCVTEPDTDLIVRTEELSQHIYQLELSGEYLLALRLREDREIIRMMIGVFVGTCRQKVNWDVNNILMLSPQEAQNVYLSWLDKFHALLKGKVELLEEGFDTFWGKLLRVQRHIAIMQVLKSSQVVGLTSTGAASRHHILEELESPIVIIEEAGEMLESHVIVSMTQHCQHLVMMGDHQQLKPGVTTHHLAKDYNLNVSLFERLLKNDVVTGTCLTTQYRMKPEISALLKPHIYSVLNDGPGTKGRPPVKGISKSIFFLDHEEMEQKTEDNTGCWNPHEVEMLINLAKYLVSMGYAPTEITIIAMYSEQKNKLIEARNLVSTLTNLQIASVDSFQGKENEIILLSLVRSNRNGNIGFLREENRVSVALSRARLGLYIVGNMKCLTRGGRMWNHVSQRLQEQGAIGSKLTLVCNNHNTVHHISKNEDWSSQFCRWCRIDAMTKKTEDDPTNSIVPVPETPLRPPRRTRCTCCQSYYCKKPKKWISLELHSAFNKLKLLDE